MENPGENSDGAPFNFAIATLMRIDRLLQQIALTSIIENGDAQKTKYRLVNQLLVNACVLIKDKKQEEQLKKEINKIKLRVHNSVDTAGRSIGRLTIYSEEVENRLNNFIIDVTNILQENGKYFMPKGEDEDGL